MKETVHVFRKIIRNGVEIKIKRKTFQVTYRQNIWDKFPTSLHKVFADSLTYVCTWHLPMADNVKLVYHFPHPPIESVFFKLLIYSIPMNIFLNKDLKTSDLIRQFYNVTSETLFKALNYTPSGKKVKKDLKDKALLLFSFGKDSLLSYSLLKELGIKPTLIFIKEPQSGFENNHKKKLANKFYELTNEEVEFFPLSIGKLRQEKGMAWGWDIILSQYAFLLLPYFFYHQSKYLFFGNEQSCNFLALDPENYLVNPVFEQSVSAMQMLQDIPKLFFIQTHVGSLIEPIHEIFITYILHHRYPEIGHFQMSCFSEEPESKVMRWCCKCEKCARMYIFFRALGINPEKMGFHNGDMLSESKEGLYLIFEKNDLTSVYGGSGLGKDEQLLAFYMAYKNGVKGELIDKFKKMYLEDVEKRKDKIVEEFFGIHTSLSLPSALRKRTLKIFQKEREKALFYVKKVFEKEVIEETTQSLSPKLGISLSKHILADQLFFKQKITD